MYKELIKRNFYNSTRKIRKILIDRWVTDHFHKQNTERLRRFQGSSSTSLPIKEIQIKSATKNYCFSPKQANIFFNEISPQ